MLIALIITLTHLDKTVVCLGQGKCNKGIDAYAAWLINAAKEFLNPDLRWVATMILNWDNDNNDIISFSPQSKRAEEFKLLMRRQLTQKFLKFYLLECSSHDCNLSDTSLVYSPLSLLLDLILSVIRKKELGHVFAHWIKQSHSTMKLKRLFYEDKE